MNSLLKIITSLLLLVNGLGAIYGGSHLIKHPDGSSLQMSLAVLKYSPFQDFLIPGVILFTANGLFSILVLLSLVYGYRNYSGLVIIQGSILTGWILVQIMMLQMVYYLHAIFGFIGIVLILAGWLLRKYQTDYVKEKRTLTS
jgi:hypothetical protein